MSFPKNEYIMLKSIANTKQPLDKSYIDEYGIVNYEPCDYENIVTYNHIGLSNEVGTKVMKSLLDKGYIEGFDEHINPHSKKIEFLQLDSDVNLTVEGIIYMKKLEVLLDSVLSMNDKNKASTPFIQNENS